MHTNEPIAIGLTEVDDLILLQSASGNIARLSLPDGTPYRPAPENMANAERMVAAWNLCHGAEAAQIEAAAAVGLEALLLRPEPRHDPWHLFRIEVEDIDGSHTYFVSAQSGSAAKAQELAEAAALDDSGTEDEPAELGAVTALGITDSDIFEKVGPHAAD